jgi:hypothetical protein
LLSFGILFFYFRLFGCIISLIQNISHWHWLDEGDFTTMYGECP